MLLKYCLSLSSTFLVINNSWYQFEFKHFLWLWRNNYISLRSHSYMPWLIIIHIKTGWKSNSTNKWVSWCVHKCLFTHHYWEKTFFSLHYEEFLSSDSLWKGKQRNPKGETVLLQCCSSKLFTPFWGWEWQRCKLTGPTARSKMGTS